MVAYGQILVFFENGFLAKTSNTARRCNLSKIELSSSEGPHEPPSKILSRRSWQLAYGL